jgi:predicted GNAT family acetyltransferase
VQINPANPRRLARLHPFGRPHRFVNLPQLANLRRRLARRRRLEKPRQLSSAVNRSKLSNRDPRRRRRSRSLAKLRIPRSTRSMQRNMSTISHDQKANQFTTEVDGYRAELDYTVADDVMTITHTRVPQAIGGRGVAAQLMREAVKVAGERGWSINPACSYAAAYMRKHAQAPDKRHIDELLDEALEESFPASDSPSVGGSS